MNTIYCDLNICLPEFMLEILTLKCEDTSGGALGRDLNYEGEAPWVGPPHEQGGLWPHWDTQEVCVLGWDHPIMLDPGSQTSSLPNVRNKFLLFISHLVCRILWQQPEQTKTLIPITRHSGKDRTSATVKGWVIAGSLQGAGGLSGLITTRNFFRVVEPLRMLQWWTHDTTHLLYSAEQQGTKRGLNICKILKVFRK